MVRFGVLGAGRIGKVHARTIAASGRAAVAYLADPVPTAAEALAADVGARVASVDAIIAAKDVDAILIASPTPFHAEQIEAASNAGKAVLCEKPVSLSVDRIRECLAVVERNATTLMVGFNRRYDRHFAELARRIRGGDVGAIEIVTILSRDPAPPPAEYVRLSGGIYRDMMIHDFDLARFLVGEEFVVVQALGASLVDPAIGEAGDADTTAVQMQTASGRIAVITNSRRSTYGYDQRVEVHGSLGMVRAANMHTTTVELGNAAGFHVDPALHFFTERYAQAYASEVLAFIDAVTTGRPVTPNGFDGLQAQKLADAATVSWKTRSPVEVS